MWSAVCSSSDQNDPEAARAALEVVCQRYWLPARKFVQSMGCSTTDAEDITQNFFAQWAHPEKLALLDPEKGRLRHYLKASLRRFYISEWRKQTAAKRGGAEKDLSLDEFHDLPGTPESDAIYDITWATTLVQHVLEDLAQNYSKRGKENLFQLIRDGLPGGAGLPPYAGLAVEAGLTEPQIKLEVHRLRRRFADCLRDAVSDTLTSPNDLDDELRYLLRVLAEAPGNLNE